MAAVNRARDQDSSDLNIIKMFSFLTSLEIEIPGLPLEEITEYRPDNHHNRKIDDLLLGRSNEGSQDIGSDEKFEPEDNFTGEFIPYLVIDVITFLEFQKKYFDGGLYTPVYDEDCAGKREDAS